MTHEGFLYAITKPHKSLAAELLYHAYREMFSKDKNVFSARTQRWQRDDVECKPI